MANTEAAIADIFGVNMNTVYGYIRVSSTDQNDSRQQLAMQAEGITPERLFVDKLSGKDFCRPQYKKLLRRLRRGDQLCIMSIDRLGRNYEEILEQWRLLTHEMGVDIYVWTCRSSTHAATRIYSAPLSQTLSYRY